MCSRMANDELLFNCKTFRKVGHFPKWTVNVVIVQIDDLIWDWNFPNEIWQNTFTTFHITIYKQPPRCFLPEIHTKCNILYILYPLHFVTDWWLKTSLLHSTPNNKTPRNAFSPFAFTWQVKLAVGSKPRQNFPANLLCIAHGIFTVRKRKEIFVYSSQILVEIYVKSLPNIC